MKKILIFSALLMISLPIFSQDTSNVEEDELYSQILLKITTDDSLIAEQLKGVQYLAQKRDSLFEVLTKRSDPVNHPIYNQANFKELNGYIKLVDSLLLLSIKSCIEHIDYHAKYYNDYVIITQLQYWGEEVSIPLLKVNKEIFKKRAKLIVAMGIVNQDRLGSSPIY